MTEQGELEITLTEEQVVRMFAASATKPRVYLAGPIRGLDYGEAVEWRSRVAESLAPEIVCYSPMRGKEYLDNGSPLPMAVANSVLSNSRAIMTRDHNDCRAADLIIAHLVGAESVSIGTVMEIAWSYAYRVPLVLVHEAAGEHEHPMIREAAGWLVSDLDEAVYVARSVLLP